MVNNKINVNVIDGLQPILDRVVDYDNITNCITEIPQDIKLELNNGTLTLKAGSKVYVPNGSGKFDEVVVSADRILTGFTSVADNTKFLLFINSKNQALYCFRVQDCYSSGTAPTITVAINTMWYDTSNNIIQNSADQGSTWGNIWGLPLAIVTASNKVVTSIDQVFNGFGYIGSTAFILPGVKGLISDGWNADGTYNNIISQLKSVYIQTFTDTNSTRTLCLFHTNSGGYASGGMEEVDVLPTNPVTTRRYYLKNKNEWFWSVNGVWTNDHLVKVADIVTESGVIKSLKPQLPFRAVDQNDFNKLDEEAVKTSGDQTITGRKMFANQPYIYTTGGDCRWWSKTGSYEHGTAPSHDIYGGYRFLDKNNVEIATCYGKISTNNVSSCHLYIKSPVAGSTSTSSIGINCDANGNFYTNAPTPPTGDNSGQIATTAWVNNKHQVVTALPSSPTTGVFYFIKE